MIPTPFVPCRGGRGNHLFVPKPVTAELLAEDPRPVTLLVVNGSWRQASEAALRLPGVEHFENVTLPPGPPSRYELGREPKEGGLATMEAIARAFGVLEGAEVQQTLEALFLDKVRRTLITRDGG